MGSTQNLCPRRAKSCDHILHNLNLALRAQKSCGNAVKGKPQLLPFLNIGLHMVGIIIKIIIHWKACVIGKDRGWHRTHWMPMADKMGRATVREQRPYPERSFIIAIFF